MNQDFFSFPEGTIVDDCARALYGELADSLRDEDGYLDTHDMDHYGDQLNAEMGRDIEILAAFAEDACRFCGCPLAEDELGFGVCDQDRV